MAEKAPAFQFYTGDWMKDPALRSCSVAARGLWIDMLCLMWDSPERGHLRHSPGGSITPEQLGRISGCTGVVANRLIAELESCGVLSRGDDGVIQSRRMIRDDRLRKVRAAGGVLGGNPSLKVGGKVENKVNLYANLPPTPSSSSSSSTSEGSPPTPPSDRQDEFDFDVWLSELRKHHPGSKGTEGSCRVNAQLVLQDAVDIANTAATISANQTLWIKSWQSTPAKYIPALPNWLVRVDAGGRSFPCLESPPETSEQIDTRRLVEELCSRTKTA